MDANQDILQSQWPEIKGQVRTQWGNLTDDDVRQLSGTTAAQEKQRPPEDTAAPQHFDVQPSAGAIG
jgi:hypothetical protein